MFQDPPTPEAVEEVADAATNGDSSYLDAAVDWLGAYSPAIIGAILTFIIGRFVAKFLTGVLRKVLKGRDVDATLTGFLCSLVYFALIAMVLIATVGKLGVDTTSFAAIMAALVFALGFSLQSTLGDVAAGVMLILFRPFKSGDFIECGGGTGVVEEIGIFVTMMRTGDNKAIIVPNSSITGGTITNFSAKDTRRVDLVFGIGYGDDIKLAKDTLAALCAADDRILKDPAVTIAVSELADSSVNFVCRPWVKSSDYWGVFFDLTEKVKLEFDAKGLSIPFPQRDLHVFQETA